MTVTDGGRPRRRLRRAAVVTVTAVAVLVLLGGLVWGLQRSLIYLPTGGEPPSAGEVIEGAEDVRLHTDDGLELGAWYVPARDGDRGTAVLVANGNAGNREMRAPLARALSERGFSVLLFDYRGYGGNPGTPSEEGLASDARAAADALAERGHGPDGTLYFGESLGAAVVVGLADERPPAGLFLRSPFSSLADMARTHYPFVSSSLLRDTYPVVETVGDVDVPTSVAMGEADTIVPAEQSREVAGASPNLVEEVVLEGVGHNDAELVHGPRVVAAFTRLAGHVR
ncbi:alpha/beta hydrolase [Nocardiopsis quinghaiensis]|uniref:alpha/beta hydrolase n=1 Tax=Nocardiopsis quinghaiensis TaxID=464995 RepID=UPI00123A9AF4|nr:alpha/beta hydrolase [Nocardiopsis quinghaiensis]